MEILVIIGKFIFTTLAVYIGTNIANDASAQWNRSKQIIENSIEQGKDLYNRVADDVSTYYNMFKDPKKAKEWLNKLLEAWLSNQSEILVNAFMINKFKAIIDNMKKLADEGFKKDLDYYNYCYRLVTVQKHNDGDKVISDLGTRYYYDIATRINIEIPIIQNIFDFQLFWVSGNTKIFYN